MDRCEDATHYLRQHKFGITGLRAGVLDPIFKVSSPILVSTDEKGTLVIWELVTRRPLLVQKLGDAQIVSVQLDKGKYVSILSKDHTFRMYELYPTKTIDVSQNINNKGMGILDIKKVFEVPVNTLNFANFGLKALGDDQFELVTSHTKDAHFLDIYEFKIPDLQSLKRYFRQVELFPMMKQQFGTEALPKIDGLGIVMQILVVENDIIFCGFESGFVVGLRRYKSKSTIVMERRPRSIENEDSNSKLGQLLNSSSKQIFENEEVIEELLEIISVDTAHYPEPVLSLVYDEGSGRIISSSTTCRFIIENTESFSLKNENRMFNVSDYYIDTASHIVISKLLTLNNHFKKETPCGDIGFLEVIDENIIFGTWSGRTYKVGMNQNNTELAGVKRKSSVFVTESPIGNSQSTNTVEKIKKRIKIGAMTGLCKAHMLKCEHTMKEDNLTPGKLRRTIELISTSWYFIGYEDGSISMYKLENAN